MVSESTTSVPWTSCPKGRRAGAVSSFVGTESNETTNPPIPEMLTSAKSVHGRRLVSYNKYKHY